MKITPYNPEVTPNTVTGEVRGNTDINAVGGMTASNQARGVLLDEASKQLQLYMDGQIKTSIIDAKNKYEQDMTNLLHNPDTGLLNRQDINALDVTKQYEQEERKIRRQAMTMLPNYKQAKDAFEEMANGINTRTVGTVMEYQYNKDMEHRKNTMQIALDNDVNAVVQNKNWFDIQKAFIKNQATAHVLFDNVYGDDVINAQVKAKNTNAMKTVMQNLMASGNDDDYNTGLQLLDTSAPFINIQDMANIRQGLLTRQHENFKTQLAKEAFNRFPDNPIERKKWIIDHSTRTVLAGGANTGNAIHNYIVNYAKEYGLNPQWVGAMFSVETGGGNPDAIYNAGHGGYGQITDGTAKYMKIDELFPNWRTDPQMGIKASIYVLKKKIEQNGGDVQKGLYAYNGGGDPQYMKKIKAAYDYITKNNYFEGGNSGTGYERNLIEGFNKTSAIPQNGRVGCAEVALAASSWANPIAADAYKKGLFNVREMAKYLQQCDVKETSFNPDKLNVGDFIVYQNNNRDYAHVVVYDGRGGFYGNSSSANNGKGGKIHGDSIYIPGLTPTHILHMGAGSVNGTHPKIETVLNDEEIEQVYGMANNYARQQEYAQNVSDNNLFEAGTTEMDRLHKNGITAPETYHAITEKYGTNARVYSRLLSVERMYSVPPKVERDETGTGGGRRGRGTGATFGGGFSGRRLNKDDMVILKSQIGYNFSSLPEIFGYCKQHGLALTPTQQNDLAKTMGRYLRGENEYAPEYKIDVKKIAREMGKNPNALNIPVAEQLTRQKSLDFENKYGRMPTYNELKGLCQSALITDINGYTQTDLRSDGFNSVDPIPGTKYSNVYTTGGNHLTIYNGTIDQIKRGEQFLINVERHREVIPVTHKPQQHKQTMWERFKRFFGH